MIEATTFEERGGEIYLVAEKGICEVSGTIAGTSIHADIFSEQIHITETARFETPMSHIRVGGSRGGKDKTVPHALASFVSKGAFIDISGQDDKDGGSFILWGDKAVEFEGTLSGRSGPLGGHGGFVEVSSHGHFICRGPVDLYGIDGYGTLLWDPVTVTISSDATMNATIGDPTTFSADTATINNDGLRDALNLASVSIDARNAAGAGDGSITWSSGANITDWTANTSLSLTGTTVTLGSQITSTSTAANAFLVDATGAVAINAPLAITGSSGNNAINITTTGAVAGTYAGIGIAAAVSSSSGNITMTGQGGDTGGSNHGISMTSASGSISIADGNTLTLNGTGGGGSASSNNGISFTGGTLTVGSSTGTGTVAILTGVGGGGTSQNRGVLLQSSMTAINMIGASKLLFSNCSGGTVESSANEGIFISEPISSPAGEIAFANITGGGTGAAGSNYGLRIFFTSVVAPVIRMDATDVTGIRGGPGSGSDNTGIIVEGASAVLGSNTLTTELTLTASSLGTGSDNYGIKIEDSSINIADGGTLTLNGHGGGEGMTLATGCYGIYFEGGTLTVGSSTGATAILTGTGGGGNGGGSNEGIRIALSSNIVMNGASALRFRDCRGGGTTGGGNSGGNLGILIARPITTSTANAEISFANITGGGSGTGTGNYGLSISNAVSAPTIRMETEYSTTGIRGGNASGQDNTGIRISGGSASLGSNTVTTSLTLTASSLGTGTNNHGIRMEAGSINIADGGTLTLDGTAGLGNATTCKGIYFSGGTLKVGNSDANMTPTVATLTGAGKGGIGSNNYGVEFASGMSGVEIHGTAKLLFKDCSGGGTGGSGSNYGVVISKPIVTSATGAEIAFANITGGGGGGTGINNYGLFVNNVELSAPVIRMDATDVNGIRGGNASGTGNTGIRVAGASAALGSNGVNGTTNLTLTASSLGTGSSNFGIEMASGSINIVDTGTLTLNGTGGGEFMGSTASNCYGIIFSGGTLNIGSSTGATAILTGVGKGGTGGSNRGVNLESGITAITMNGASALRFRDCMGGGTAAGGDSGGNYGVRIAEAITTTAAGAEITFANITGGGSGTGTINYGLWINNVEISAPTIRMETEHSSVGIRGGNTSGGSNHGILLSGASAAIGSASIATSITLTGSSLGTGSATMGIRIDTGAKIQSALGGTITLDGTGADGTGTNYGIQVTGTNSAITTATGAISLTGAVANANTADGIRIESSGTVQSTGAGTITLDPTGSAAVGLGVCTVSSGAALNFNGPVNLTASTPAVSAATTATFTDTINGAFAMNVSADTIALQGIVGGTTPVGALSLTGTSAIQVANNITTNNATLTFTGPVSLTGSSSMSTGAGAGNASFSSTVTGNAANRNLTVDAGTGSITFSGALGTGGTPLGAISLTTSHATGVTLGGDVTANSFTTTGTTKTKLSVAGTTTIDTSAANGAISFGGTVDGTSSGAQNLTLDAGAGTITVDGEIGGGTGLGIFDATAGSFLLNADITATSGSIDAPITPTGERRLKKTS